MSTKIPESLSHAFLCQALECNKILYPSHNKTCQIILVYEILTPKNLKTK